MRRGEKYRFSWKILSVWNNDRMGKGKSPEKLWTIWLICPLLSCCMVWGVSELRSLTHCYYFWLMHSEKRKINISLITHLGRKACKNSSYSINHSSEGRSVIGSESSLTGLKAVSLGCLALRSPMASLQCCTCTQCGCMWVKHLHQAVESRCSFWVIGELWWWGTLKQERTSPFCLSSVLRY